MLAEQRCVPCKGGVAISAQKAQALAKEIPGWKITDGGKWLRKEYSFKNFLAALAFVNKLADVAEAEQHHPDIELGWGYVKIRLQTHDVGGLHTNDFIVAAKIDALS